MQINKETVFKNCLGLIFLCNLLTGCAHLSSMISSDAELLTERAKQRWQALINKDWETAYNYELPAYRKTYDVNRYRAKFGRTVQWKAVEIVSVEVVKEAVLADVNLKLKYQFSLPDAEVIESDKPLKERWMKQEGEWWIVSSE